MCKVLGSFQATFVFFSTFSILLIAVDRYRFIVHPSKSQISISMAVIMSVTTFILSMLISAPLYLMTELEVGI